jgi:photosystem II stability/assembly factor-like uncharacterized protein
MSWTQFSGCETGQVSATPNGKILWGVCKGEVGRYNVDTGQEQHFWIYPQNRYGHDPDEIRERFPRQSIVYVSPHDPKTIYHAGHRVYVTRDEGVTWTRLSDDLTAREPQYQIIPGNPITRDITGEEVYSSLYSFTESRLEKGVLWAGANDGPLHVSRDGGKTWTNVTPPGLVGARIQNIEDSPHRRGSAYIAAYRFMREHDLQPYVYVTNDYGKTWTKLTDGKNGIPIDHPTRVVREDPQREGLLYAGGEFGAFVSFDNGRHWQTLQQNLPATPVTDIRVVRGDLVISTMGRSFWIMDDVSPLRQLAGTRMTSNSPTLLTPRDAIRYRHSQVGSGPDVPHYPPVAASIDYVLPAGFNGEVALEVTDAGGRTIRAFKGGSGAQAPAGDQGMRGGRRGGGAAATLPAKAGHNRILWDYRFAGADGAGQGPMAAPGKFTVKLTAGGQTQTKTFGVQVDPRVTADGVTQADLVEQQNFLLKVRDAIAEAAQLRRRLEDAMKKANVPLPTPPGPGEDVGTVRYANPLQGLWAKLADAAGPYPKPVLINQLSNIARMLGQADQKVGKDAYERFNDVQKELAAIRADADRVMGTATSPQAGR